MTMTEFEIIQDYKQAKKPQKQITILAELNTCSKKEIVEILMRGGCEVPKYYTKKKAETPPSPSSEETPKGGDGEERTTVTGKELLTLLNSLWDMEVLKDMPVTVNGQPARAAALKGSCDREKKELGWELILET